MTVTTVPDPFFKDYTREFYLVHHDEHHRTAYEMMAFLIYNRFRPRSVIDVGCGTGNLLEQFLPFGVTDYVGVDAPQRKETILASGPRIPEERYVWIDLREPETFPEGCRYDLAISVEVAEHLPESKAEEYVKLLCRLAPVVVFSGAYPGQGGTGHINEQSFDYWVRLFNEAGYNWDIAETRWFQGRLKGRCPGVEWYERLHVFKSPTYGGS